MAKSKTKPNQKLELRGMVGKQCSCGYVIGVETTCDPPLFYDQGDWNAPVTHCPVCNTLLTVEMLVYSEEQKKALAKAYRVLLRRGRQVRERRERELAASTTSTMHSLDVSPEQSSDDAPGQSTEEPTTALPDVSLLQSTDDETEHPVSAPTAPPLHLLPFTPIAATLPGPALFLTVSGAHLYGFPSPDSDVDLRGVFILPQRALLGLDAPEETFTQTTQFAGYEVDLVAHDVKKFLDLLLRKNGYVLEQLYSPLVVQSGAAFEELRNLARGAITRHVYHHYAGFAKNKLHEFEGESPRRVKTLLYVYRVLLTGIHLLRTGEVEANLLHLYPAFDLPFIPDLIAQKAAEQAALDDTALPHYQQAIERLQAELDEAFATTTLPEAPTSRPALDDFLLRVRLGDDRG